MFVVFSLGHRERRPKSGHSVLENERTLSRSYVILSTLLSILILSRSSLSLFLHKSHNYYILILILTNLISAKRSQSPYRTFPEAPFSLSGAWSLFSFYFYSTLVHLLISTYFSLLFYIENRSTVNSSLPSPYHSCDSSLVTPSATRSSPSLVLLNSTISLVDTAASLTNHNLQSLFLDCDSQPPHASFFLRMYNLFC